MRQEGHRVFLPRIFSQAPKGLEYEAFWVVRQLHGIEMPTMSFEVMNISHQRQSFVLLPS